MAPLFFRLEVEVEEVTGVPTELNRRLLDGEVDLAPISSIAYARNAERLRVLPRVCVSSEGAVDSIQLVSRAPLSRVRSVAVTPESATSVVLVRILLPEAEHVPLGEDADATLLIGDAALRSSFEDPDAALRSRAALAGANRPADGVCGLRVSRSGARRARRRRGCSARRAPPSAGRAGATRPRRERALRLSGRVPRPLLREAPVPLRAARAGRPDDVLRARPGRRRARSSSRATVRLGRGGCGVDRGGLDGRRGPRQGALGRADQRRRRARAAREPRARADRAGGGRARGRARRIPAGSRSSSTGISTTRTSATRTATSAPSTARPATSARATSCRSR